MSADRARRLSLRWRLAVALVATAVVALVLAAVVGAGMLRQAEQNAVLAELRRQAGAIVAEGAVAGAEPRPTLRLLGRALNLAEASIYRLPGNGEPVLVAGEPKIALGAAESQALRAGSALEGRRDTPGGEVVFVAEPIPGSRGPLALVLARPAGQGTGLQLAGSGLAAAALAVAAAAGIALVLSSRIAGPMHELAAAARDLERGDFGRRVRVEADDEIEVVAEAFNKMAAQLEADEQMQREFLMSISHELRTPLTAIQGYAEAIEDGTAGEENTRAAGVIVSESKRLGRLVSDLLDLARLDARRFSVAQDEVDAGSVLRRVSENLAPQAEAAGVLMEVAAEPAVVEADEDRLVQVLTNLVENALRYTPAGGRIRLACSTRGGRVTLDVSDSGPGFEPADLERAFERQYLWSKYRGQREVGTGLGLVIARELASLMGGTVTASAAGGGGARFAVTLRASRSHQPDAQ